MAQMVKNLPAIQSLVGKIPREGDGNPLQYPCLENSKGRGTWRAIGHQVAESHTTARVTLPLSFHIIGRQDRLLVSLQALKVMT